MNEQELHPDYLFEVSWEVCNKVGGIHTVVSTKARSIANCYSGAYIAIGPDLWRESGRNPEFIEQETALTSWAQEAVQDGVRVRVGRWKIPTSPLVMLVDFSSLFARKDEILAQLWEQYHLDSLTGQWDYIEPLLFGYAAGQAIESFVCRRLTMRHKVVAQFHEWMTGGGLLYLRKALPQVGTVFTSHATVLGRCMAGNGMPLYTQLEKIDPDQVAHNFNVVPKHSLECVSAAMADTFTTVSNLTNKECQAFLRKGVDLVTPNGFEPTFVPHSEELTSQRQRAREIFCKVATALLGSIYTPENTLLIGTSGRYEFRSKGLDVFIDALGELNRNPNLQRSVVAFLLVPAGNKGARADLQKLLNESNLDAHPWVCNDTILTHSLEQPENDPCLRRLYEQRLDNAPTNKVKVIFVPSYLQGDDGIFNLPYYQLLPGLDLTVFASYYEPWGYTPLESLAFGIPTITSTLAGFGLWLEESGKKLGDGASVVFRGEKDDHAVVTTIAERLLAFSKLTPAKQQAAHKLAQELSSLAEWENLIEYYRTAYSLALEKVKNRSAEFAPLLQQLVPTKIDLRAPIPAPRWTRMVVQRNIPTLLRPLEELAGNLWWSWQPDAEELFASIDRQAWVRCEYNPTMLLDRISYARLEELGRDRIFLDHLEAIHKRFLDYMTLQNRASLPSIGYFSMEYGLHSSLKLYSGGLGVLAGDYLKEASDRNLNLVGVGLLYRYGYFTQQISLSGQQLASYNHQNFSQTPVYPVRDTQGNWITVEVAFPGRRIQVRLWRVMVGRIPLFLLDTDFEGNTEEDRTITHYLYGGDQENRFKQEMILGIGGVRALQAAGCVTDLYHLNEGHAAFASLERLRLLMHEHKFSFEEAVEIVRASTLFTTHTPVPAGHDTFTEDMVRIYMSHYPARYNISWDKFISFGRVNPTDSNERFSMSNLAASFSSGMNGVSKLHGEVSQKMFAGLWPGYYPSENYVGYVTNGVHFPTWTSASWRALLCDKSYGMPVWERIKEIPTEEIWTIRKGLKRELINNIVRAMSMPSMLRFQSPRHLLDIKENLRPEVLTIGFARRFATYKRAHLLLSDLDRLSQIVNNPERPVQILFAGKAHPHDLAGQELIKRIFTVSLIPQFCGKLIFLPNYDMELARRLVQGVDVWLNTPTRPLEASGTSGMKAVMNGVLHFSVLDGWWVEGYKEGAGWALTKERTYEAQNIQDELDAELLYSTIENEIAPLYYERNKADCPEGWIRYIRKSMSEIAPMFTTTRMQEDYTQKYYTPQVRYKELLLHNDADCLHELLAWKEKMLANWNRVSVIRTEGLGMNSQEILTGMNYTGSVVLDLAELSPEDVGVELVVTELRPGETEVNVYKTIPYIFKQSEGPRAEYVLDFEPPAPGVFDLAIRLFAQHKYLRQRMDFNLVRWV